MPKYLLDVNVLVAHAILEHEHHTAVCEWLNDAAASGSTFYSCPIIELGLVRNAMRIGSIPIEQAKELLKNERENLGLNFISDTVSTSKLPDWVQGYRQTTDAYLCILAKEHGLTLLTIDKGIPDAAHILKNKTT